uniref:(2Fe-2S) ferredoxin domain-containing protein n=1 Tax=Desulfonatronospira sp. TaxID=1962951 RepID=UPI0025C6D616
MERLKSIKDFKSLEGSLRRQEGNGARVRASVCCGLPCTALGSQEIARELADESARQGVEVDIVKTGCQGLCQKGPLMQVEPHGYFYQKVKPDRAGEMVSKTMGSGQPVREFLYRDSYLDEVKEQIQEVPFYSKQ